MSEREHYIELHRQLHQQSNLHFAGKSVRNYIKQIDSLMIEHGCETILDYGCGKAQFWPEHWKGNIQGYDPAYEKFSNEPMPADFVICCDVMEHIPESEVKNVLSDVDRLAKKWSFFVIDTKRAKKKFLDDSNCHVTIRPPEWWQGKLDEYCPRHTVYYQLPK